MMQEKTWNTAYSAITIHRKVDQSVMTEEKPWYTAYSAIMIIAKLIMSCWFWLPCWKNFVGSAGSLCKHRSAKGGVRCGVSDGGVGCEAGDRCPPLAGEGGGR